MGIVLGLGSAFQEKRVHMGPFRLLYRQKYADGEVRVCRKSTVIRGSKWIKILNFWHGRRELQGNAEVKLNSKDLQGENE